MAKILTPLAPNVPIVDEEGNPTPYFARILSDLSDAKISQSVLDSLGGDPGEDTFVMWDDTANTFTFLTGADHGDILFRGADGWEILPAGADGDVLTTHDVGADPTWETPTGGGGAEVLLSTQTVSASASPVVFDNTLITGTYIAYVIRFYGVYGSGASTSLLVQGSPDNGSTWRTTGYTGSRNIWQINGAGTFVQRGATPTTGLPILYDLNSDATLPNFGEFHLQGPTVSTWKKLSWCKGATRNGDANPYMHDAGGNYGTAEAWNAIRVIIGAGNLTGTFKLYGIA